jgi:hypothetical protein
VEQRSLRAWGVVLASLALAVFAGAWLVRRGARASASVAASEGPSAPAFDGDARVHASDTARITVEVLNATRLHGLARRATFYLRDRGFDVVLTGTAPDQRDSTVVLDRSRHPEWARLAARALGHARVDEQPDSSRDVDLTVLLGASWRPPAEPFYP